MRSVFAAACLLITGVVQASAESAATLQARVDRAHAAAEDLTGLAIYVLGNDEVSSVAAAAGVADPDGRAMSADVPVRIASNTKTYVAATALRLMEQGRLDLDAAIVDLVDPAYLEILEADGYDPSAINVRHLLMHVSGLPDHADQRYVDLVLKDPGREWTREEQLRFNTEHGDPLGAPGGVYTYSDTGYVLLGHILERVSEQPLAGLVRDQLGFERLGLSSTWWELVEPRPELAAPRAHQYVGGVAAFGVHPSADLFGGGGLVASTRDMARFYAALLRGEIFEKDATLELMKGAPGHPEPEAYRIGLFPRKVAGVEVFGHTGYWGTMAMYAPEHDVAIAGAVLDVERFPVLLGLIAETLAELGESEGVPEGAAR